MFEDFRDCIARCVVQQEHKHLQSRIAAGDDPESILHTLFFVGKQGYLFQASALPVYGPSDADTVTYAPTDNVLVLHIHLKKLIYFTPRDFAS